MRKRSKNLHNKSVNQPKYLSLSKIYAGENNNNEDLSEL
jgi:hypothetical protein